MDNENHTDERLAVRGRTLEFNGPFFSSSFGCFHGLETMRLRSGPSVSNFNVWTFGKWPRIKKHSNFQLAQNLFGIVLGQSFGPASNAARQMVDRLTAPGSENIQQPTIGRRTGVRECFLFCVRH